jgi:hypothetical protein
MSLGADPADRLAHALVETEFDLDAVERGPLRAVWSADNESVVVTNEETGEETVYLADDLVVATSDREVRNARELEQE